MMEQVLSKLVADLTGEELHALIQDAVTQGQLEANKIQNTGRADQVRAELERRLNDARPARTVLTG